MRRRRLVPIAGIGAAALLALALAGPAQAAGTDSTTVSTDGVAADLPGATVFGDTPADTPERVSIVLRTRNTAELQALAVSGRAPQLSTAQFADRYGQSRAVVDLIRVYLAAYGISTTALADRLDIEAQGTAGQFDKALAITQKQYRVPAVKGAHGTQGVREQTVHSNVQAPRLPRVYANPILAILGLTNYSANVTHVTKRSSQAAPTTVKSDDACVALTGIAGDCRTPQDFASRYGVNGLYSAGATGKGRTVGIVTLAAYDPGAAEYFWANVVHLKSSGRTVRTIDVDGGPGAPSDADGSGETDLDVEQSGGVARDADVLVYQAPNTDSGFVDGFFQAASDNIADSVSASWGEAETVITAAVNSGQESPAYAQAFDEAFLEYALQGQSAFVSAGDAAAYDDNDELGSTELVVDNPGDSPYITSAGGTTLPLAFTISGKNGNADAPVVVTRERAWGWDYLWQPVASANGLPLATAAESLVVGGGGGYSGFEPQPAYQRGVPGTTQFDAVQYLTPTAPKDFGGVTEPSAWIFNPTPPVTTGTGSGRSEPDFSADADPESGYLLYEPSAAQTDADPLTTAGGTSFVAPQFNGAASVLASAVGHRVGFLNPALYRLAAARTGALTPLNTAGTTNDNVYYTGRPGTVYNPATGLGTPDFTAVARGLR